MPKKIKNKKCNLKSTGLDSLTDIVQIARGRRVSLYPFKRSINSESLPYSKGLLKYLEKRSNSEQKMKWSHGFFFTDFAFIFLC